MKTWLSELRAAAGATAVLAVVCCGLYPLAVTGLARVFFPREAAGSLIVAADGTVRGSRLIGQGFSGVRYFHPRPSAAGGGYDATSSGGSNLGPTSRKLRDTVQERVGAYRRMNRVDVTTGVPADAVTASGSGLDPHISVRNAELQATRVARERGLSGSEIRELIRRHTNGRDLGLFGEPGVNVLTLNLALDELGAGH